MDVIAQLKQSDLFRDVAPEDLEGLVGRMKRHFFEVGTVLFEAGDLGDTLYIIQAGRVRIYMQNADGAEITLTHYGADEIFGELSPIDSRPRSASAAVVQSLDVLSLGQADLLAFLDERPQIGLAMMRGLTQRLRHTTTYLEEFRPLDFVPPSPTAGETEVSKYRPAAVGEMARVFDQIEAPPNEKEAAPSLGIFDRIMGAGSKTASEAQTEAEEDEEEPHDSSR